MVVAAQAVAEPLMHSQELLAPLGIGLVLGNLRFEQLWHYFLLDVGVSVDLSQLMLGEFFSGFTSQLLGSLFQRETSLFH